MATLVAVAHSTLAPELTCYNNVLVPTKAQLTYLRNTMKAFLFECLILILWLKLMSLYSPVIFCFFRFALRKCGGKSAFKLTALKFTIG